MDDSDNPGLRDLRSKPQPAPEPVPPEAKPRYRLRLRCHPPERLIGRLPCVPAPTPLIETGRVAGSPERPRRRAA
jgi:hypothetical protein